MATRARKVDGGYSLTRLQDLDRNATIADVFVVWASTEDGLIRGFILEKGWKGLSAPKIQGKGWTSCLDHRGEVVMDDVFVPEEICCPTSAAWADLSRLPLTSASASASPGARWVPLRPVMPRPGNIRLDRQQFGRRPARRQPPSIQKKLADMATGNLARASRMFAAWPCMKERRSSAGRADRPS